MTLRKGDRNRKRERQEQAQERQEKSFARTPVDQLERLVDRECMGCGEWDRLMKKVEGKAKK